MNLDLRQFETFPAEFNANFEADNVEFGIEGVAFCDLMNLRLTIHKVNEDYYCQGHITVPVEEECARCLIMFPARLYGDLDFVVKAEENKGTAPAEGEEVIYTKTAEPVVDLTDLIRETLILSLPMKPLCDVECKGLCPDCGANLNEETCECKHEESDERWEGLKDLL